MLKLTRYAAEMAFGTLPKFTSSYGGKLSFGQKLVEAVEFYDLKLRELKLEEKYNLFKENEALKLVIQKIIRDGGQEWLEDWKSTMKLDEQTLAKLKS
jgi:hypothetical protein